MKKKSLVWLILSLTILVIGVCGCMNKQTDSAGSGENKVTLSQRQKDILAQQGLPTEYDALPAHQQRAIVAIEEMLSYAEAKYDMAFSYAGYAETGPMEAEHLRAYPSAGHMAVDTFTITKTETGYEDDFVLVAAGPRFAAYVQEQLQGFLPQAGIKVYAQVTETSLSEVPTAETVLDGKVDGSVWIFVDGEACSGEAFTAFQQQAADFMQEHQLYGMMQFILLKEGNLIYLTEYNYTDYLSPEHYDSRETLYSKP